MHVVCPYVCLHRCVYFRKKKILQSLRVQKTMLMMKHKKCLSKEESIILQNDQSSEKLQDGKYIAIQYNKLNIQNKHCIEVFKS